MAVGAQGSCGEQQRAEVSLLGRDAHKGGATEGKSVAGQLNRKP